MSRRFLVLLVAVLVGCGDDGFIPLPDGPTFEDNDGDGIENGLDNCPDVANADQVDSDADGIGDACDDDIDNDGIANANDNCPLVANADQVDTNGNGEGDACDGDADGDGIANASDNCVVAANADQLDSDADGMGDACDPDDDNDTVLDPADNCVLVPNADQLDSDTDTLGNACDDDDDNDTVLDADDNCPLDANTDQANGDGDAAGDVCDTDLDNDGVLNAADNCPLDANAGQENHDADTLGDACDDDDDGDGVDDVDDNCPVDANANQLDSDEDGLGDACDPDDDNDGVADVDDNCRLVVNAGQQNHDNDALGDACDDDDDNDTVLDNADNCPIDANADQADADNDGIGDVCDIDTDNDGIVDRSDNCPTVFNPGQEDADNDGTGNACEILEPSFENLITGGNIIAVGATMAGRFDGELRPSANLTIENIPAGATIISARLYWTVIGTTFPQVTLNGTDVTGTEIGQTGDTCWRIGNNVMYRADVTSMVTGNGTFALTNLLSNECCGPDGQGISLVVVFSDPADPRHNLVTINDGAIGFVESDDVSTSIASGFTVGAGFDAAKAINLVADGQPASDSISFQGTTFGGGDAFVGADGGSGAMWDTRIDDISSVIAAGQTSVTTTVAGQGDCLAWSMSAVVIEDIDDTTPDVSAIKAPPTKRATPSKPLALPTTRGTPAARSR